MTGRLLHFNPVLSEGVPPGSGFSAVSLAHQGDGRGACCAHVPHCRRRCSVPARDATGPTSDSGQTGISRPRRHWQRLAEAREKTDPAGAFAVYLRLADVAPLATGRGQYHLAARRLKAARRAAAAAGIEAKLEARILAIREQHRRWPSLIEILDRAGL